jgi:hypothetical protein
MPRYVFSPFGPFFSSFHGYIYSFDHPSILPYLRLTTHTARPRPRRPPSPPHPH